MPNDPKFGPTGDFPLGKLNEFDEGGLQIGITLEKGNVVIDFGVPVKWVAMPPQQAMDFAALIIKHAQVLT